ncbi:MAG TPA: response regulator [Anaerolineales bacterium]|nr:response regulator [Anaerolineales bacterium]
MANLRALVCDDEAPLRDLMARRLEKMGLDVDRAEDGKDAVARIDSQRYDVLVTDIYMPDVTGLELLQRMKALDPHAQVVVVTASATLDNAVGALNHGAFAYLTKPFDHLTVFDNVVARAVEFRKALLDNLRMGEVQRRRGDLLEEEIAGRIRQVKRAQQYLVDLLGCLPVGVAVLDEAGRVDLINSRAEDALEPLLVTGPDALREVLARVPLQDGEQRGEVEIAGRRLEFHLTQLTLPEEGAQQVLVVREPESAGPAMGTMVTEMLTHVRSGVTWLARREPDGDTQKILRGMAGEILTMATFLGVDLPPEEAPVPRGHAGGSGDAKPAPPAGQAGLAPAVLPPPRTPAAAPGNGKELSTPTVPHRLGDKPSTEPLPQGTGSLMLRKGMTMVLEGRLRKKRPYGEPKSRPQDPDRLQEQIDRWARSGSAEAAPAEEEEDPSAKPSTIWPPPLPSSNQES